MTTRFYRYGLPVVLGLVSTLLVTVMGLVVDEWVEEFAVRLVLFGVLLVAFLVLSWLQLRYLWLLRSAGTLYYLRADSGRVPSLHAAAAEVAGASSLDLRAIRRTFSIADAAGGGVDIRSLVGELRAEFDSSLNADSNDSAFSVVPDVAWPVAVAVGYDWIVRGGTRLVGFSADLRPHSFHFPRADPLLSRRGRPFDPLPTPRHARSVDGRWVDDEHDPDGDPELGAIGLVVAVPCLDAAAATGGVQRWADAVAASIGPGALVFSVGYGVRCDLRGDGRGGHDLREVVDGVAGAIRLYLERFPAARIHLVLDVPDIVSLAVGWRLANPHDADMRSRVWEFWERVVPLYGRLGDDRTVPLRVHPAQCDPAVS